MEPTLIISAIIRLVSLQYVIYALFGFVTLPGHLSMLATSMSDPVKACARGSLISDAMTIGFNLIIAAILWFMATHIASFVMKTLTKGKNS